MLMLKKFQGIILSTGRVQLPYGEDCSILYVPLSVGFLTRPWELGSCIIYARTSLSVLPPTAPLLTFDFSALRRTRRLT